MSNFSCWPLTSFSVGIKALFAFNRVILYTFASLGHQQDRIGREGGRYIYMNEYSNCDKIPM